MAEQAVGPLGPSLSASDPTTTTSGRETGRRTSRKRAHAVLRSLTTVKRVRHCSWVGVGSEISLRAAVTPTGLVAGVAGTQTCGSVWACPTCAAKISDHRTRDLQQGISRWLEPDAPWLGGIEPGSGASGSLMLVTLTVRHHKGQSLASTWDLVSKAWRLMVGHRDYKSARRALGVAGYHRTTESTVGDNGWHLHLHVLYFLRGDVSADTMKDAGTRILSRWMQSVQASGGAASIEGQDFRQLKGSAAALNGVAAYVHKGVYHERLTGDTSRSAASVALEVGRSDLKRARKIGSRSPFEVLADIVAEVEETGSVNADDAALWAEWETTSRGRRQQVWSRGLRDMLGLGDDLSDEDVAAVQFDGDELVKVDATDWKSFTLDGRREAALLDLIEAQADIRSARAAAAVFLTRHGVPFEISSGPADEAPAPCRPYDDGPALARPYRGLRTS